MGSRSSRGKGGGGPGGARAAKAAERTGGIPIAIDGMKTSVVLAPRSKSAGDSLVTIDTAKFDAAWKRTDDVLYTGPRGGLYVGKDGSGAAIRDRYPRFKEWLRKGIPIEASEVSVRSDGLVGFTNGRHRFAVMRDSGLKKIPVAMPKEAVKNAKKFGLLG